jgi:hypothetical protein
MTKKGYLPGKDAELVAWSDNFSVQVSANAAAWGIPEAEVTALVTAKNDFETLHLKADSPERTSVIVAEKNTARKKLTGVIRALVDFRLKNPVITDAQLTALGLHVRDTTRTPIPIPATRPELDIDVLDVRRLLVRFHDQGSAGKAKPYGVNGTVIGYAVLDAPPADPDALNRSVLATHTPYVLEFTEEERGKTVYIALRWQNEKGGKGPWSEIETAIIP